MKQATAISPDTIERGKPGELASLRRCKKRYDQHVALRIQ